MYRNLVNLYFCRKLFTVYIISYGENLTFRRVKKNIEYRANTVVEVKILWLIGWITTSPRPAWSRSWSSSWWPAARRPPSAASRSPSCSPWWAPAGRTCGRNETGYIQKLRKLRKIDEKGQVMQWSGLWCVLSVSKLWLVRLKAGSEIAQDSFWLFNSCCLPN